MSKEQQERRFVIDIRELTERGLHMEGELPASVMTLEPNDSAKPVGGLRFNCEVSAVTGSLLVLGEFEAPFELICVRCGEPFEYRVKLQGHALQEELENKPIIDLTETVREDILLALPAYPRCDEGPLARDCPVSGRFESETAFTPLAEEDESSRPDQEKSNPWEALDGLDTDADS